MTDWKEWHMPLVRIYHVPRLRGVDLYNACYEVVPAAFNSEQGPLTPGSIEFFARPLGAGDEISTSAFVEIEAYDYEDRRANLDQRAVMVKDALQQLFPGCGFAVWSKLVIAGWARDNSDPGFDGDMSMEAAVERAFAVINQA
jgi:hypothetical protein